ncbi:hypothetical protein QFC19_003976 [Naganishia cerealis]|uniref:Uncharacterized protein n=1 Tax=Naganishia cerealis TaxID=610337 RepID=A0ACC2VXY2_9TREE|nr:hypothetical protein QFC19_003976 [Naganishia cerealis]
MGRCSTYFFLTSPNSGAPVKPTIKYVPFSSFRQATTMGCTGAFFLASAVFVILSRVASISQIAKRDRVLGFEKIRRSGPSRIATKRNVRSGLIAFLSSTNVPCRIIAT